MILKKKIFFPVVCVTAVILGGGGCAFDDSGRLAREKMCVDRAKRDAQELKKIVNELLPPGVPETVVENNSCDSGIDGVYLVYEVERSANPDEVFKEFRTQGWKDGDLSDDECKFTCIARVGKVVNERYVDVFIERREKGPFEITASYAS